jgi:hypothetical protein
MWPFLLQHPRAPLPLPDHQLLISHCPRSKPTLRRCQRAELALAQWRHPSCSYRAPFGYGVRRAAPPIAGPAINLVQVYRPGSGLLDLTPSMLHYDSETAFSSALCVIRSPSYLVWSRTFLLGFGLTDLGDLGRHLGGNKAIDLVGVFNGPVVWLDTS